MFWGLSPALNLQEEYLKHSNGFENNINILLIGSIDARHILKTIAEAYKYEKRQLNFVIMEPRLELVARQLLLLSIALENSNNLGIGAKARMFMEIYGNTLLRSITSRYLVTKSKQLVRCITDLDYMKKVISCVSFENMKYKERDYIELQMKFWQKSLSDEFNICELWDRRVRLLLGPRYDVRNGVFDWDYYMRLKDIGGQTIGSQEYNHFRQTGVAFTWLETEVSRPNCSLAAGVVPDGNNLLHRGYLGDIQTGPFIAYGLDCEDPSMMKTTRGVHVKRATDITERNIMRIFHEIEHKSKFDASVLKDKDVYNLGLIRIADMQATMSRNDTEENTLLHFDENLPSLNVDSANIIFYSFSNIDNFCNKDAFRKYFDVVFLSNQLISRLNSDLMNVAKEKCLFLCETNKFLINLSKETVKTFDEKITNKASELGLKQLDTFDSTKDCWMRLVRNN